MIRIPFRSALLAVAVVHGAPVDAHAPGSAEASSEAPGAKFDAEAVGRGTPADYDFLVGSWTFVFEQRGEDGTRRPARTGTWEVRKAHGGLVIEDVWRLADSDDPTLTYRVFDPTREHWTLRGVRPKTGTWDPGVSWSDGDERFVVQTFSERLLARIRYYDIRPDGFRWRADGSLDGGKTWTLDLWTMEVTRAGGTVR